MEAEEGAKAPMEFRQNYNIIMLWERHYTLSRSRSRKSSSSSYTLSRRKKKIK